MNFKQFLQKFKKKEQEVEILKTSRSPEAIIRHDNRVWHVEGFKNFKTDDFNEDVFIQEVDTDREATSKQRKEIRQKILNHLKQ